VPVISHRHIVFFARHPKGIISKKDLRHIKKKRGYLAYLSRYLGSRIAFLPRISNAEAHAVCIYLLQYKQQWTLALALHCSRNLNLRDSNKPQIKRQHNVFPICLPYRQSHATKQSTARQCYKKNIYEGTFFQKKNLAKRCKTLSKLIAKKCINYFVNYAKRCNFALKIIAKRCKHNA